MAKTQMSYSVVVALFLQFFSIDTQQDTQELAPALYIFGDSTVDSGNNNNLATKAKANHLPYGIDFNNTPTGRFTNGMTIADYIATFLGLPFAPAYLSLSGAERSKIATGLNYASASCGILPETGSSEGICLTLDNQTDLFKSTIDKGLPVENLETHLAKSIFFISIGGNDYTFGFLRNNDTDKPSPVAFAKFLVNKLAKRLQTLYELGARKFLLNGIGPIGCTPVFYKLLPHEGECDECINQEVAVYNPKLSLRLKELQNQLPGFSYTQFDDFKWYQQVKDNPERYGITDTNSPCYNENQPICEARDEYLFFYLVHTSQAANKLFASAWFNESSTLCAPLSILKLALV